MDYLSNKVEMKYLNYELNFNEMTDLLEKNNLCFYVCSDRIRIYRFLVDRCKIPTPYIPSRNTQKILISLEIDKILKEGFVINI